MDDEARAEPRVVFDASVWVSAFMYPASVPDQAVDLARRRQVQSILSDPLIDQVQRAILGPRFARSSAAVRVLVAEMRDVSRLVVPAVTLAVIAAKESDNRVLECAVAGRADVIVTGDRKHVLPLGSYEGIRIVSPAAFLRSLGR
jgi:putative PIN family toxin of toxin-antitoxin system